MDKYLANTQNYSEEEDNEIQNPEVPSPQEQPEMSVEQKAGAQWKKLSGERMSKQQRRELKTQGSIGSTQKFLEQQQSRKRVNNDLDSMMSPASNKNAKNNNIYTAPHLAISIQKDGKVSAQASKFKLNTQVLKQRTPIGLTPVNRNYGTMSARSSESKIQPNLRRQTFNERTYSQNSNRGPGSSLMSQSPSRIGKGTRQKTGAIDENFNDDILRVFQEDEANMNKFAASRNSNSRQGIPNQDSLKIDDSFWQNDASKPLFNDDNLYRKMDKERKQNEDKQLKKLEKAVKDIREDQPNNYGVAQPKYQELIQVHQNRYMALELENDRLKHFLPDRYTEIRLRDKQLQERLSRYECAIVDYENEKKSMSETLKYKEMDIQFIKAKYEESNGLWHNENLEKQKLEAVIEQQYRESMELDTLRRRSDDDKNLYRNKNMQLKTEIEQLIKDNNRLAKEKQSMNMRMSSLRQVNKQAEKMKDVVKPALTKSKTQALIHKETEKRMQKNERWAEELEEKLNFTVEKFEEQNSRFMECGKELAEAQQLLEKYEENIEELVEEKGNMKIKLEALQLANLGQEGKQEEKKEVNDNISQKTGATKFTENDVDVFSNVNYNSTVQNEKVTIDFLKKQNQEQLDKIQKLEYSNDQKEQEIYEKALKEEDDQKIKQKQTDLEKEIERLKQELNQKQMIEQIAAASIEKESSEVDQKDGTDDIDENFDNSDDYSVPS